MYCYACVRICRYIDVYTYMYGRACMYVYICIYIPLSHNTTFSDSCIYLVYIYTCVCVYLCVNVCTYMYV